MRWANGTGWTTEIVARPDPDRWQWRVSMADIDADGPFSVFGDVTRTIALVAGSGCVLSVQGRPDHVMDEPFVPFAFDGGSPTTCRLLDGPVQDLNLMQRGAAQRSLTFVTIGNGQAIELADVEVLIVMAGHVELSENGDRHVLDRLDALLHDDPNMVTGRAGDGPTVVAVIGPTHARCADPSLSD